MEGRERVRAEGFRKEKGKGGFVALLDVGDVEWSTKYCFAGCFS